MNFIYGEYYFIKDSMLEAIQKLGPQLQSKVVEFLQTWLTFRLVLSGIAKAVKTNI